MVLGIGETRAPTKVVSTDRSLRTTIPISIVKQLNLSESDKLDWEIKGEIESL